MQVLAYRPMPLLNLVDFDQRLYNLKALLIHRGRVLRAWLNGKALDASPRRQKQEHFLPLSVRHGLPAFSRLPLLHDWQERPDPASEQSGNRGAGGARAPHTSGKESGVYGHGGAGAQVLKARGWTPATVCVTSALMPSASAKLSGTCTVAMC